MSNLPVVFDYRGQNVRTVMVDGEPWFVIRDICEVLELGNVTWACQRLDADEFSSTKVVDSAGRSQETAIVNEAGLYSLVLGSRKAEARAFKRWVTHEVLPAIRKTGAYAKPAQMSTEDLIILQAQSVKELKSRVLSLEEKAGTTDARLDTVAHRVASLDCLDIEGTPRQRLNAMVRKYAFDRHLEYRVGWYFFIRAYNTALRTNLRLRLLRYHQRNGGQGNLVDYLETAGLLLDALRVADKMLNDSGDGPSPGGVR